MDASLADFLCATAAFLLCSLVVSPMLTPQMQPKRLVLLAVLPFGVVALWRLLRSRDLSAIAGSAFVFSAASSAFFSSAPGVAFLGAVNRDQSVLVYACAIGLWALGRHLSSAGRSFVVVATTVAVGLNGLFSIAQLVLDPSGPYALYLGRPTGLAVSPVVLGAVAACVVVAALFSYQDRQLGRHVLLAGSAYFLVVLTSSRAAIAISLVAATFTATRLPARRVGILAGALIGAHGAALLTYRTLGSDHDPAGYSTSTGGLTDRLELWTYAMRAVGDRPLFGVGPGRFHIAVQPHTSDEWVIRFVGDGWKDAHNVLIEILVSTGLVGLVAFVAFVVLAARQCAGVHLWMAAACAATWMLQPASIVTLPLAALLLGAARHRDSAPFLELSTQPWRRIAAPLAASILLTGSFLLGDGRVDEALREGERPPLSGFATWYRWDPDLSDTLAESLASRGAIRGTPSDSLGLAWSEWSVRVEPDNATGWAVLGLRQLQLWRLEDSAVSAQRALQLRPNDPIGLQVLAEAEAYMGNTDDSRRHLRALCEVLGRGDCDVDEALAHLEFRRRALEDSLASSQVDD